MSDLAAILRRFVEEGALGDLTPDDALAALAALEAERDVKMEPGESPLTEVATAVEARPSPGSARIAEIRQENGGGDVSYRDIYWLCDFAERSEYARAAWERTFTKERIRAEAAERALRWFYQYRPDVHSDHGSLNHCEGCRMAQAIFGDPAALAAARVQAGPAKLTEGESAVEPAAGIGLAIPAARTSPSVSAAGAAAPPEDEA